MNIVKHDFFTALLYITSNTVHIVQYFTKIVHEFVLYLVVMSYSSVQWLIHENTGPYINTLDLM